MKKPLLVIDVASKWSPGAASEIFDWPRNLAEYGVSQVEFVTTEKLAKLVCEEAQRLKLREQGRYVFELVSQWTDVDSFHQDADRSMGR